MAALASREAHCVKQFELMLLNSFVLPISLLETTIPMSVRVMLRLVVLFVFSLHSLRSFVKSSSAYYLLNRGEVSIDV